LPTVRRSALRLSAASKSHFFRVPKPAGPAGAALDDFDPRGSALATAEVRIGLASFAACICREFATADLLKRRRVLAAASFATVRPRVWAHSNRLVHHSAFENPPREAARTGYPADRRDVAARLLHADADDVADHRIRKARHPLIRRHPWRGCRALSNAGPAIIFAFALTTTMRV
jgi:hypothetical protein